MILTSINISQIALDYVNYSLISNIAYNSQYILNNRAINMLMMLKNIPFTIFCHLVMKIITNEDFIIV